jgi:hypothetical protein
MRLFKILNPDYSGICSFLESNLDNSDTSCIRPLNPPILGNFDRSYPPGLGARGRMQDVNFQPIHNSSSQDGWGLRVFRTIFFKTT